MANGNNTMKYVVLGAAGVAIVYLITRNKTSQQYVQQPSPYVAQQQLQQWAQTQSNPSVLTSVLNNLSLTDIMDLWDRIFGSTSSSSTDVPTDVFSGGGADDSGTIWDSGSDSGSIWV